jgi:type IV pilus assembly protein PilA
MKSFQKGFTLIELMIVIAIIGILAAIAIPAYQNYTIRSQVTEGLSLADGWKTAVSEYYDQNGTMPTGFSATGGVGLIAAQAASTGKYVSNVTVGAGGQIQITYSSVAPNAANAKINGLKLDLSPGVNANGDVVWVCGKSVPPATPGLAPQADATTVPAQYLPTSCHA